MIDYTFIVLLYYYIISIIVSEYNVQIYLFVFHTYLFIKLDILTIL